MVQVCLDTDEQFAIQARYALGTMLDVLGMEYKLCHPRELDAGGDGFMIYYGDLTGSGVDHLPLSREGRRALICIHAAPLPEHPVEVEFLDWEGERVPLLAWAEEKLAGDPLFRFASTGEPAVIFSREKGQIFILGDVIASAFYLLSRREEYRRDVEDEFGRFPGVESLAHRQGFLQFPVVDAYIALLDQLMFHLAREYAIPYLKRPIWPDGFRWALCLSHDVDWVRKWTLRGMIKSLLGGGAGPPGEGVVHRFRTVGRGLLGARDPYDNLADIQTLEERFGANSTFFFLPGVENTRHAGRKILGRYPKSFEVGIQAGLLVEDGCEVGLHGSFDSIGNYQKLAREKDMLTEQTGTVPIGIRQHFLRYRFPDTPRIHEQAGLEYDTTLGYGDHPGYRCGISYPFKLFDVEENNELAVAEIPLVIMDGGLAATDAAAQARSRSLVDLLLGRAERFGGVCTVLWHNTSFCRLDDGGILGEIYQRLLQRGRQRGAWLCSCDELLRWWRWRSRMKIVERSGSTDESAEYGLQLSTEGPDSVEIRVAAGGAQEVVVDGCRSERMEDPDVEGMIRLRLSDWTAEEIRVRVARR